MLQRITFISSLAIMAFLLTACSGVPSSPPVGGCTVENFRASAQPISDGTELTVGIRSADCTEDVELLEYKLLLVSTDGEARETYLVPAGHRGEADHLLTVSADFPAGAAILTIVEPAPVCQGDSSCAAPEIQLMIQAAE